MSGGKYLLEVFISKKILAVRSLLKEGINFLEVISPNLIKHCTLFLSIKNFAAQAYKIYYSVDFTCNKHQEWEIKHTYFSYYHKYFL